MLFFIYQVFDNKDIEFFVIVSTDADLKVMGFLGKDFMIVLIVYV